MIEGVDYSWARPSPAGLYAAGKRFAMRYLSYDPAKNLSATERTALWQAGLAIGLNWEATAGAALNGAPAGRVAALHAQSQAAALGGGDQVIYFSVDVNVSGGQIATSVRAYFQGIAEVIPAARVGLYGEYDLIEAAQKWGTVSWFWQTAAVGWSPAGKAHPKAHIVQYHNGVTVAGGDCDLDRAMTTDYGQWEPKMAFTKTDLDTLLHTDGEQANWAWSADFADAPGKPGNKTIQVQTALVAIGNEAHRAAELAKAAGLAVADLAAGPPLAADAALLAQVLLRPEVVETYAKAIAAEIAELHFGVVTP
jgi:hypothetical protein